MVRGGTRSRTQPGLLPVIGSGRTRRGYSDSISEVVISLSDTQTPHPLEIAVAVGPGPASTGASLPREVQMVKASLLYADRVTLASVAVALHLYFHLAATGDLMQRAVLLHRMLVDPPPPPDEASAQLVVELRSELSEFLGLQSKRQWRTEGKDLLRSEQLKVSLEKHFKRIEEQYLHSRLASHYAEFETPVREGVLAISDLGVRHAPHTDSPVEDIISRSYRSFIVNYALSPSGTALPMLDRASWEWIQETSGRPPADDSLLRDAREAALAEGLLGGLPSIPDAPMDIVLEVREEIAESRASFRAAVASAAAQLQSAPGDESFERDRQFVQRTIVDPAIQQIEAHVNDRKVTAILGRFATAPNVLLPGSVALSVALAAGLDQALVYALGAGAAAINALAAELRNQRASQKAERRNGFYLLYDAERRVRRARKNR